MIKQGLTPNEKKVMDFIVEYHTEHGYMPSLREICKGTGITSTNSTYYIVHKMLKRGYLETDITFGENESISPRAYRLGKKEW